MRSSAPWGRGWSSYLRMLRLCRMTSMNSIFQLPRAGGPCLWILVLACCWLIMSGRAVYSQRRRTHRLDGCLAAAAAAPYHFFNTRWWCIWVGLARKNAARDRAWPGSPRRKSAWAGRPGSCGAWCAPRWSRRCGERGGDLVTLADYQAAEERFRGHQGRPQRPGVEQADAGGEQARRGAGGAGVLPQRFDRLPQRAHRHGGLAQGAGGLGRPERHLRTAAPAHR